MVNIQNEIYHFYQILFVQNVPIASYTIDFSEIKDMIDLLGLDSHYAILSSFHLHTFDAIYGGEPLVETDWGYRYKDYRYTSRREAFRNSYDKRGMRSFNRDG